MRVLVLPFVAFHLLACASSPHATASAEVRRAAVNGTEIAYAVEGAGAPLVIVHGAFGDLRSFSRAATLLARTRMVVRMSLRLHWPNPSPGSPLDAASLYLVENHARDVAALIDSLDGGPADVLGHSYGGVVAATLARSRPDLIRRLILVEPALFGSLSESPDGTTIIEAQRRRRDEMLARIRAGEAPIEVLRTMVGPERFDSHPDARRQILTDNAQTLEPILVHNPIDVPWACSDTRRLTMPVLLVEGARTGPNMREINSMLQRCLPDARRVVLPDAGHAIQFDAPEALARVVAQFAER